MTKGARWTPFIDPPKEGEVSLVVLLRLHALAKVLVRSANFAASSALCFLQSAAAFAPAASSRFSAFALAVEETHLP